MAKKQKYYVVWVGAKPGVYSSWQECQLQIKGYPGAKYKSFPTMLDAKEAYHKGYQKSTPKKASSKGKKSPLQSAKYIAQSISVDAACSGNPGLMEYRGVRTYDAHQIFHQGPFKNGTNNIGEFLALVHALALLKKKGKEDLTIYTDSKTAMAWVRNRKVKTTLRKTNVNEILFELIERGENWLKNNQIKNPIVKWPTEKWGEIPADFGRK